METRMCRSDLSSPSALVLGLALLVACISAGNSQVAAQEIKHMEGTNEDRSLECIDHVLGKRTVASMSVDPNWLMSPCPDSRSAVLDLLKRNGLRFFDAAEFVYVIPSKFFPPFSPDASPVTPAKWSQIKIAARVR